ncbi:MAG: CMP-N-acetlyneuraminic acid synthetase, partial [Cetobacterium sp.]
KIAEIYGAEVPFIREEELSDDNSKISDVIIHILEKYEKVGKAFDYFMLLQPTSPLRDEVEIIEAYKTLKDKNVNSVISVSEADHSPLWMNTLN